MFSIGPVLFKSHLFTEIKSCPHWTIKAIKPKQDLGESLKVYLISRLIFPGRYLDTCLLSCLFFLLKWLHPVQKSVRNGPKQLQLCKNPSDAPKEKVLCFVPVHAALMTGFQWKNSFALCYANEAPPAASSKQEIKACEWAKSTL